MTIEAACTLWSNGKNGRCAGGRRGVAETEPGLGMEGQTIANLHRVGEMKRPPLKWADRVFEGGFEDCRTESTGESEGRILALAARQENSFAESVKRLAANGAVRLRRTQRQGRVTDRGGDSNYMRMFK